MLLWIFKSTGIKNTNNKTYPFRQQDNRPTQLSTNEVINQRLACIHNNPVEGGPVAEPEHYLYSSAANYSGRQGVLKMEVIR